MAHIGQDSDILSVCPQHIHERMVFGIFFPSMTFAMIDCGDTSFNVSAIMKLCERFNDYGRCIPRNNRST
jgi:hypothetical protein